jgi:hypothetical protein
LPFVTFASFRMVMHNGKNANCGTMFHSKSNNRSCLFFAYVQDAHVLWYTRFLGLHETHQRLPYRWKHGHPRFHFKKFSLSFLHRRGYAMYLSMESILPTFWQMFSARSLYYKLSPVLDI